MNKWILTQKLIKWLDHNGKTLSTSHKKRQCTSKEQLTRQGKNIKPKNKNLCVITCTYLIYEYGRQL